MPSQGYSNPDKVLTKFQYVAVIIDETYKEIR
jgi:hypothetical protein